MLKRLTQDQRGITGLETAIILIAFVVVAAVFAYTVLSAGTFSAEKGKEAIHSGLETARSSMKVVGNISAKGVQADTLDNADSAWTGISDHVTPVTTNTTDKKEGTASAEWTIDAAFTSGGIAYTDLGSTADISDHYSVRLWIKTSIDVAANVLYLLIYDIPGCEGSPPGVLFMPAITAANGWTRVQVKIVLLGDPSALTAVACVKFYALSDLGAVVVNVDLIEAPGELSLIQFVVANALGGEAVDLSTTSDADSDGLLSDEATKSHVLSVDYVDKHQRVGDVAWARTQLGKGTVTSSWSPARRCCLR